MAIQRFIDASTANASTGGTAVPPPSSTGAPLESLSSETADIGSIESGYKRDAETPTNGMDVGVRLPKDMTVKLVRADSAGMEIFLSILYSLALMVFGVFWGALIDRPAGQRTTLEISAVLIFGVLAGILLSALGVIKRNQRRSSVVIPTSALETFSVK